MGFFDLGGGSAPRITKEHLREWGNEIASSYLNAGALPSTTLQKIALSEELAPHHIEAVAAEANRTIHQAKYASADDKYHAADFPLANAKEVIRSLQADGGEEKVAVAMPAPRVADSRPDPYQMFGVKPETMDKTASVRGELKLAQQKMEVLHQKQQDAIIMGEFKTASAEKAFIKEARQVVLNEGHSSDERMQVVGYIDNFAKQAGMGDKARSALGKLAYVLGQEGLLTPRHTKTAMDYFLSKEADNKAPQELISQWLDCKVVNGQHPLYITLKTFKDQSAALELHRDRHQLIEDRLHTCKQKIRAL